MMMVCVKLRKLLLLVKNVIRVGMYMNRVSLDSISLMINVIGCKLSIVLIFIRRMGLVGIVFLCWVYIFY